MACSDACLPHLILGVGSVPANRKGPAITGIPWFSSSIATGDVTCVGRQSNGSVKSFLHPSLVCRRGCVYGDNERTTASQAAHPPSSSSRDSYPQQGARGYQARRTAS